MPKKTLRDAVAELRWLAVRLEMLGPPGPSAEDHVAALTRAMTAQAIRVIAGAIEEIDAGPGESRRTRQASRSSAGR